MTQQNGPRRYVYKGPTVKYKKLRYRWQTARRVYRSVKVTKHGTIWYARYGFLLVSYSKFVREIFDSKNAVTLKTGLGIRQGH